MIAKHGMAREVCVNIFMAGNDAARVAVVAMAEYIGSVPLANDVDREQALAVGTASLASALTRHAESIVTMLTPSGSA
jgi:hypothetical protein